MQTRVIVSAVIEKRGYFLFGRKPEDKGPYPNTWHLLGGGVHPGESLTAALQREVLEEAGITIKITTSLGFDEDTEPNKHGEKTHYIFLVFHAKYISGTPHANDDIKELKWFPKRSLPSLKMNEPSKKLFKKLGYL